MRSLGGAAALAGLHRCDAVSLSKQSLTFQTIIMSVYLGSNHKLLDHEGEGITILQSNARLADSVASHPWRLARLCVKSVEPFGMKCRATRAASWASELKRSKEEHSATVSVRLSHWALLWKVTKVLLSHTAELAGLEVLTAALLKVQFQVLDGCSRNQLVHFMALLFDV